LEQGIFAERVDDFVLGAAVSFRRYEARTRLGQFLYCASLLASEILNVSFYLREFIIQLRRRRNRRRRAFRPLIDGGTDRYRCSCQSAQLAFRFSQIANSGHKVGAKLSPAVLLASYESFAVLLRQRLFTQWAYSRLGFD
jgi:hypothetical protein